MAYKGFKTDERVIVTTKDLLEGRVKNIKYKKGFTNKDITSDRGTTAAYTRILFKLLELIVLDVIDGTVVIFNKRTNAMFYIDFRKVSQDLIKGKGLHDNMKTDTIDLRKTGYKMPFVAFDPGYIKSEPCSVYIPSYLFSLLIDKVNSGSKYTKSLKDFWFNK